MNVFAKFDEIPSMILQDIKETKRYGHMDGRSVIPSFGRTDGQRENRVCEGYNKIFWRTKLSSHDYVYMYSLECTDSLETEQCTRTKTVKCTISNLL